MGCVGAVWYQGESNAGEPERYRELLPLMIRSKREAWGQGDFPFGVVQLAPFESNGRWAELREAAGLWCPVRGNAGLVVLLDVGNPTDIHPADKQTVGSVWGAMGVGGDVRPEYSPHRSQRSGRSLSVSLPVWWNWTMRSVWPPVTLLPVRLRCPATSVLGSRLKPPSLGIRSPLREWHCCRPLRVV